MLRPWPDVRRGRAYGALRFGRVAAATRGSQPIRFGPLAGFTFGNGIAVERAHDQQYRLEELTGGGVEDLTYAYDPGGNIDAITDNLNASFSRAFAQDALDRLTSDQGAFGTRTYQYDSVGNRTGRWLDASPEQAITVVSNSNRLATINAAAVSYDAAGNVLADGTGRTFGYNDLNRLATASVSGQTVATYAHNAFGERARKTETTSSTSTVFAYAPGGQILTERRLRSNGTRESEREYLWLDLLPIAMAERTYAADGTTVTAIQFVYLHADHLDTPRLATDAAQRVVWRWRSDAFGIGAAETDPDGDSIATDVPLRSPGQYFDLETGLQYNYFRDYDPSTGRYVESDPIGLDGGLNSYSYVSANPLRYIDPLGLFCIPLSSEMTEWRETWRAGNARYIHVGVVFSDVLGTLGKCLWVKSVRIKEERDVRSRQLCFECNSAPCSGERCGWTINYGDWRHETRLREATERRSSVAIRIFTGNDIEAGDWWFCNNPWTGQRARGRMR